MQSLSTVADFASGQDFACDGVAIKFLPPGGARIVLESVFRSMAGNRKLRSLKLEACGLSCSEVHFLAAFLKAMPLEEPQLEFLSASHNPGIADEGCSVLSSAHQLFQIDTVHLVDINLTAAGLRQLSYHLLQSARVDSCSRLRKLCIGSNDFSGSVEPEDVHAHDVGSLSFSVSPAQADCQIIEEDREFQIGPELHEVFRVNFHIVQFLRALSTASITYLDMKDSRMNPDQMKVLSNLVPKYLTALETFDLYGVGSIGMAEPEIREMVKQCVANGKWLVGLKRLAFDQLKFPDLWKYCQACFRGCGRKGGGKGKPHGQKGTNMIRNAGVKILNLGTTFHVGLVDDITRSLSRKGSTTSVFRMRDGSVFLKDGSRILASSDIKVGDTVQFQAVYNATSRCLGLTSVCRVPSETLRGPCQDQCHVFFYRYEVGKLLVIPGRSAQMRKLAGRLDNLCMEPGPYLEERFPGCVRKGQCMFPSFDSIIADVDVSAMTDDEVHMLARLENPEHFLATFGRRLGVNETVRALVDRVKSQTGVVARYFQGEESRRASSHYPAEHRAQQVVPRQATFSNQIKAVGTYGDRDTYWAFPPLVHGALSNMLEADFLEHMAAIGQRQARSSSFSEIQQKDHNFTSV
ncbi:unnamed protein product [Prorocentrum cordatum]|uniref:RNA-directed RNA polymerase n=1 Tax=Prorocentrum cordatum TaxID=2364126 RepID=A0ABN9QGI5_9DINO|nr:unnamed protein product [Polarella glacialis]